MSGHRLHNSLLLTDLSTEIGCEISFFEPSQREALI